MTRMIRNWLLVLTIPAAAFAGEKTVVSLRDFCRTELKSTGIEVPRRTALHIVATGGGADRGWSYRSDELFAAGWIINADTRELVWRMTADNTGTSGKDRTFDGTLTLDPGTYEVYFSVPVMVHHTAFTHMTANVDHRNTPLFGGGGGKKEFFRFFRNWFSDDLEVAWKDRCAGWGIDLRLKEEDARGVSSFTPPRTFRQVLLRVAGVGENVTARRGFALSREMTLSVYAIGEGVRGEGLADYAWIVDAGTRKRVWDMAGSGVVRAGGADKNLKYHGEITLPEGEYVLYYQSDDSHSADDWNAFPPYDPLNWGITLSARSADEARLFRETAYNEFGNAIVEILRVGDNESRSQGFTLTRDADVRIHALGERSNSRRLMADYGYIIDARTRAKVWTMEVDRTSHAGGGSKNRLIDEVIRLRKGSYIVVYQTDDSHAWGDWNDAAPADADRYGITVMTLEPAAGLATKYTEQRNGNVIAQITRVRDDADQSRKFTLDRTTRLRVYAIGEGQNRKMYDYGWIEDARTGGVVWEMTFPMTFHAGGHRKNRMVNTTVTLDRGDYRLRYTSDDSHCYGDWNVDPPEDQEFWGITLFKDEGPRPPLPPLESEAPEAPSPPEPPRPHGE